jgi:hypothetical protein
MLAGRGSIATSSRVSCIRLTTHATSTTKPIPSFGSRRSLPRVRTEILRRRPRGNARAVVGRPPALPGAPAAVVRSVAADRCAAPSQAEAKRGRRRVVGWVERSDTHRLQRMFGRHHPRRRVIQYSRASVIEARISGVLDPRLRGDDNRGSARSRPLIPPDTPLRSRGAMRPSFAGIFLALQIEGAGKTGCALHPRSRVQNCA